MKLSHPRAAAGIAALLIAAGAPGFAAAAPSAIGTWRCGNTYTDQPCHGGKTVDFDDTRNSAQKREADNTTRDARATADRLERERLRQEAQGRARPVLIDNKPQATASSAPKTSKKKAKKEADHFSAHDPVATARNKAAKAKSPKKKG